MKTNIFVGFFVVILIIGAAVFVSIYSQGEEEELAEIEAGVTATPNNGMDITQVSAEENSLSIPAFSQQEFNGSDFAVGRVLAETEAYTRYYITYKSNGLTISGIMNVPKGEGPSAIRQPAEADKFPILILNHGYIDPAVYTNGRGLKREQDYLARQGYVVIHPDYRNHADSDSDPNVEKDLRFGYVEDVINAIKAVQSADLPYVDSERVGMLGHSMGGGIALVIMTAQPELVDAFVLFAPVSSDARDNFEKWTTRRPEAYQAVLEEHGSPIQNPEFWDGVSPRTFFNRIQSPIMIHHGTVDDSTPIEWSQAAANSLKTAGKNVTFHTYPGEPHEFINAWPTVMQRTTEFFDQYVKRSGS